MFLAAGILALWGGIILLRQIMAWMRYGRWPALSWSDGFRMMHWAYPTTEWAGIQKILDWFMSMALAVLPPLVGMVLAVGWVSYADRESPELREARSMDRSWRRMQATETEKKNPKPTR